MPFGWRQHHDPITVTVLAFNKNNDEADVLRFKQLTLFTYA